MALSLIGVSITRSQPKRSSNPSLVLNAPPYTPTSSPIKTTAGSRSISSNIACLMASRKVTCIPSDALPFDPAPFVLAMAISAPFSKRPPEQPSLFSLAPLSLAFSPLAFGHSQIYHHSQPYAQRAAYPRSESARTRRRCLCQIQTLEPSKPPSRSIWEALPPQSAVPTLRGSCGNRPRCSRRRSPQIPLEALVNFPQTHVPRRAECQSFLQSLSCLWRRAAFRSTKTFRTARWGRALPSTRASPSARTRPRRAARAPGAENSWLRSRSALRPRAPAPLLPSPSNRPPRRRCRLRCNSRCRTLSRGPPNSPTAPAYAPASNTPKDYFRESKQTAPSARLRNSALRETPRSSCRRLRSRSSPRFSAPDNVRPWPRRSSPESNPLASKSARRYAERPNPRSGWCHPCLWSANHISP